MNNYQSTMEAIVPDLMIADRQEGKAPNTSLFAINST